MYIEANVLTNKHFKTIRAVSSVSGDTGLPNHQVSTVLAFGLPDLVLLHLFFLFQLLPHKVEHRCDK